MAMGMKTMGAACCCCHQWLWTVEHRFWDGGQMGGSSFIYRKPDSPTQARESEFTMHNRPAATLEYDSGTAAPDWKNKRVFYTYIDVDRSGPGGTIADMHTVVKWWDAKSSGVSIGTPITTLSSFLLDHLATDADNEHIYFNGTTYPYLGWDWFSGTVSDASVELKRMDYDGSNLTTLATVGVYRAGGGFGGMPGIGCMIVNRAHQRLYYVKRHNYTTSSVNDWLVELCYRELGSIGTENVIYSVPCFSSAAPRPATTLLNCISFDFEDDKVYWCEHYQTTGGALQANAYRAELDGSNRELLVAATSPFSISHVRYSNKLGRIIHEEYDTVVSPPPRGGLYIRSKTDWNDAETIGTIDHPEVWGSPYPSPASSYLWCGYEVLGPEAVA